MFFCYFANVTARSSQYAVAWELKQKVIWRHGNDVVLLINVYPYRCVANKYLFTEWVKLRGKVVNWLSKECMSLGYFILAPSKFATFVRRLLCNKQLDSVLCACLVSDRSRLWSQNVVQEPKRSTSGTRGVSRVCHRCSYHIWTLVRSFTEQTRGNMESIC